MKTVIQLTMFILGLVVIVNMVIFIKELELGFSRNTLYRIPFVAIPGLGIFYLYRHYLKLIEKAEDELKKKIEQETLLALNNTEDYVLSPNLTYLFILLLSIACLGIAPLYFGIKLMSEYTESAMAFLLLIMIIFGLLFGLGLSHAFFILVGKPVIRINQQGISHFMMDLIEWKDITGLYLHTGNTRRDLSFNRSLCAKSALLQPEA